MEALDAAFGQTGAACTARGPDVEVDAIDPDVDDALVCEVATVPLLEVRLPDLLETRRWCTDRWSEGA